MNDIELGWICGLFEGEGCLYVKGSVAQMSIYMTDRDVIDKFHRIVRVGYIEDRPGRMGINGTICKDTYGWRLNRLDEIQSLISKMFSYMGTRRRDKMEEALAIPARTYINGLAATNAAKTHCPQGHEYAGDNLYVVPYTNNRMCRTCMRERTKNHLTKSR